MPDILGRRRRLRWFHRNTPHPAAVPELIEYLREGLGKISDPIRRAQLFYFAINYIHPFEDGNGRLARVGHEIFLGRVSIDPRFIDLNVQRHAYSVEGVGDSFDDLPKGNHVTVPVNWFLTGPAMFEDLYDKIFGGIVFEILDTMAPKEKNDYVWEVLRNGGENRTELGEELFNELLASRQRYDAFKLATAELVRCTPELKNHLKVSDGLLAGSVQFEIIDDIALFRKMDWAQLKRVIARSAELRVVASKLLIDFFVSPESFLLKDRGIPQPRTVYEALIEV